MSHRPILETIVIDKKAGLKGYVVVSNMVQGKAMGGTRIAEGVTLAEVRGLANAMTLKLALSGVPIGGSKAGINCSLPPGPERERVLRKFGESVSPLLNGGIYMGTDLGCSFEDRQIFHDAAKYTVPVPQSFPCTWGEFWKHAGEITGHGAYVAGMSVLGAFPLPESRRTIVVQGFGKAGQAVAKRFEKSGYRMIAVADIQGTVFSKNGLSVDDLIAITNAHGTIDRQRLPAGVEMLSGDAAWLNIDCGVLVLAARGGVITPLNQSAIKAQVIVEAANAPVTAPAQELLYKRGVIVAPDIIANCGSAAATGLILIGDTPQGVTVNPLVDWCFERISGVIRGNIASVLKIAETRHLDPSAAAMELARQRAYELFGIEFEPPLSEAPSRAA